MTYVLVEKWGGVAQLERGPHFETIRYTKSAARLILLGQIKNTFINFDNIHFAYVFR